MRTLFLLSILLMTLMSIHAAWALPYTVTTDVSSVSGMDAELEFQLLDNDPGNVSILYIDNVVLRDALGSPLLTIDFETGDLQGFDDSLSLGSVNVVAGGFTGGSYFVQMDEDPFFFNTIVYKDFFPLNASTLSFDYELVTAVPALGVAPDGMTASLLDPFSLVALISRGATDPSDPNYDPTFYASDSKAGNQFNPSSTSASVIPEPSTLILLASGLFGFLGIGIRRRRRKQS